MSISNHPERLAGCGLIPHNDEVSRFFFGKLALPLFVQIFKPHTFRAYILLQ